jgi:hypothetical protein
MDKKEKDLDSLESREKEEKEDTSRSRAPRKTSYERIDETQIPDEIKKKFAEDNWSLAYKRYSINNEVQLGYLSSKLREGWEFVTGDELPTGFSDFFEIENFRGRQECVVNKDLVLMKADVGLIESIKNFNRGLAKAELDAVDINVLEKKGFKDLGTKSEVTMSEPKFSS